MDNFYAYWKSTFLSFWKEKLPVNSILLGTRLLNICFRVCFGKKKPRAIQICIQKRVLQMSNMFEWAKNLPHNSILLELPQPGILLPGHPGGVYWYEQHFWTDADLFDLGQQADFYTKTILVTHKSLKISKLWHRFKISPIFADLWHY